MKKIFALCTLILLTGCSLESLQNDEMATIEWTEEEWEEHREKEKTKGEDSGSLPNSIDEYIICRNGQKIWIAKLEGDYGDYAAYGGLTSEIIGSCDFASDEKEQENDK